MKAAPLQVLPVPASAPSEPSREALVDEYGELDRQILAFKPAVDRHEALKKLIKSWYDEALPSAAAVVSGNLYDVQVSPREMEAVPNKTAIWKQLKKDRFIALCGFTQKAIKEAPELGPSWVDKLFFKNRTGSRTLVVVPKASPAAPAPKAA